MWMDARMDMDGLMWRIKEGWMMWMDGWGVGLWVGGHRVSALVEFFHILKENFVHSILPLDTQRSMTRSYNVG